ncbi:hypothetical protein A5730_18145 [Mycobacterium sp. ACS4054]|uniref:hypothetical protein n=1 Tax=Mycobacterium sp. ACS4054 TaxID=1834119 RepID=UPI0007FBAAD9|nr:hypothetical protein A5730_18145 [Mycobacterium sp. ACS4054]
MSLLRTLKAARAEVRRARDDEFARVVDLPPTAELAAQLMAAFGSDGPKPGKPLTQYDFLRWVLRRTEFTSRGQRAMSLKKLVAPVREALQVLEHCELVYLSVGGEGKVDNWRPTNRGLTALAGGHDAVAQCISRRDAARSSDPVDSAAERLRQLETLRAAGAISELEYTAKRGLIVDTL